MNKISPLVRLFTERTRVAGGYADEAMKSLVARLRGPLGRQVLAADVDGFLIKRKILETSVVPDLPSDGYVQPLGSNFQEGFRIVLRRGSALTRIRFTIAHELCHTFFYEIVPELKFGSREIDFEEERLCNLGAGELLIPTKSLRRCARRYCVSIDSLEELAAMYVVSPEAMLLRLRQLKLWNCELSCWRPKQTGFSLDRIVGGRKVNWIWPDDTPLKRAWNCDREIAGRTYVELRGPEGGLQLRLVCFQVVRRGDTLMVLWGGKPLEQKPRRLPLFESQSEGSTPRP